MGVPQEKMRRKLKHKMGTILLIGAIGCSRPSKEVSHFAILESDSACGETTYRTIEIQLLAPQIAGPTILKINEENLSWNDIASRIGDIYKTRIERFAYLRVASGVKPSDRSNILHLLEGAGLERVCLLDFKARHKYVAQPIPSAQ